MKNIRKIVTLSKPLFKKIVLLSLLVLVTSVLQQFQPFFVMWIVNNIEAQIVSGSGNMQQVLLLMLGMLLVNLMAQILSALGMRFGDYISSRLRRFLTEEFYQKVFTLPQRYFDSEISGKILNQLSRGIQSIQDFVDMMTNFVMPAIFQSIFTIAILLYYNVVVGLMALAIFPAYILISNYSTKKWGREEVKKNKLEDQTRGRIQEVIANIRLVRGYMTQTDEWALVSKTLNKVNQIYDKQSTSYHIINFFREFSLELVLMAISLIVFYQTFLGVISIGVMVLILQLLNQLRRPLFAMSFILERIQRAESGSKEYFEVLELPGSENFSRLRTNNLRKRIVEPSIKFEGVDFAYDKKGEIVLKDLSFQIEAKQTVALVGHSGAGKSTIINLILKFYQPTKGEIYLNDMPYSKLSHAEVRSHIALVFQENELFSTTVRENVAYGLPQATDEEIYEALRKANAYDFVMKFSKGIEAEIGERGVKLSGGQKQRIQIARAILHDAPILIMDEATSSLDSKSESEIQVALENLMNDKLVIIIAHRFSTIQNVDRILVVDQGKLADAGDPQELAKRKGVYAELLQYQIEGNQKLLEKYELH
jgi:ATP-binding cassette subfamily B protein